MSKWATAALATAGALIVAGLGFVLLRSASTITPTVPVAPLPTATPPESLEVAAVKAGGSIVTGLITALSGNE